jgi:hypothetical protein
MDGSVYQGYEHFAVLPTERTSPRAASTVTTLQPPIPGLSKRTILAKNYHPNVHFIRTTPSIRIYPADRQLPADGFLHVHAGKNPSARTHSSIRVDTARPCGRSLSFPPSLLPPSLAPYLLPSCPRRRSLMSAWMLEKNK